MRDAEKKTFVLRLTASELGTLNGTLQYDLLKVDRWLQVHSDAVEPERLADTRTYREQLQALLEAVRELRP